MEISKTSKGNMTKLIIMSFFRFCGDSLFYGYLTRYLKTLGFDSVKLGLLLSIVPFMAVIGNLTLSKIATNTKKNILIIEIWTVIEGTFILISGFYTAFWFVVMFDVICCFCSNSFYNILDTFTLPITRKDGKTYAFGRMWGTLAYIVGTFSGGALISAISYKYTFVIGGVFMIIAGIVFLFIKFDDFSSKESIIEEQKENPKYRELFVNKNFIIYSLSAALLVGSLWASDNAFALYTDTLNISSTLYGYSYGLAIITEGLSMIIFSKVNKPHKWRILLFCSICASLLKNVLMAIPNMNQYVYLLAEGLRGITYGLFLVCHLNILQHILGKRLMKKGMFITIAIDELLAATLDFVMPTIIDKTSYTVIFCIIIGIIIVSLVLFTFVKIGNVSYDDMKREDQAPLKKEAGI